MSCQEHQWQCYHSEEVRRKLEEIKNKRKGHELTKIMNMYFLDFS